MSTQMRLRRGLAALIASAAFAGPAAASLDANLIVNFGAEAGPGDGVGDAVVRPIPGWSANGIFSVLRYDATGFPFVNNAGNIVFAGNFPNASSPGPADRGLNMFWGGGDRASSFATQLLDLSLLAGLIDLGQAQFALSGWLGGYLAQDDRARLAVSFLDVMGNSLAFQASIETPDAATRGGITGLFLQSTQGIVPAGTRAASLALQMFHTAGRTNDAYADNLAFSVTAVPEPATYAMLAAGLALVVVARRRMLGGAK